MKTALRAVLIALFNHKKTINLLDINLKALNGLSEIKIGLLLKRVRKSVFLREQFLVRLKYLSVSTSISLWLLLGCFLMKSQPHMIILIISTAGVDDLASYYNTY